ncbi:MAG TPA: NADP-dependent oxidoreductase [Mycobacteriales bacterium]|jgi:NADPH:quinone reductase-like Zn-dependent oxidoreductase|nr:NADP-dependent oxidoreductase [Mycobacteriales bacterium]
MRALHVPAIGAHEQLSDLPVPEVVPGTVLVRVKAAALNAIDNVIAVGMLARQLPRAYPVILGRDVAGVVEAVGSGVEHVRVGDEVVGTVPLTPPLHAGTLADYALVPACSVVVKPPALSFVSAAAIPLAGAVAIAAVQAVDPAPGQTVLVNGASGGVGSYAIQLVAARGAEVLATGTAEDAVRLKRLGAGTVLDHTLAPLVRQVRALRPGGVDALIDLVAYTARTMPLGAVAEGGVVASALGAADPGTLAAAGLTGANVSAAVTRELLARLADQVATGSLTVDVTTVLSLDQAIDGLHTIAAGRARGKIVVSVAD